MKMDKFGYSQLHFHDFQFSPFSDLADKKGPAKAGFAYCLCIIIVIMIFQQSTDFKLNVYSLNTFLNANYVHSYLHSSMEFHIEKKCGCFILLEQLHTENCGSAE